MVVRYGAFIWQIILNVFIHSIAKTFVYGELGRFPLFVGRFFRIIRYWFKIIESQDHKYVNIVS